MTTYFFSAPGRTEISGNHTDHQRGRVLAAAVNLDTVAAVRENGTDMIRILSAGYPRCEIDVKELTPREDEINTTPALIRGVAARITQLGCEVKGWQTGRLPIRFSFIPRQSYLSLFPSENLGYGSCIIRNIILLLFQDVIKS